MALAEILDRDADDHRGQFRVVVNVAEVALAVKPHAAFLEQTGEDAIVDVQVAVEIAVARLDLAAKRIARRIEQRGIGLGHGGRLRGSSAPV